jgi:UDP-N-acetylmuramoyl-tripeptide--D-alanyl-D-alanine ligase
MVLSVETVLRETAGRLLRSGAGSFSFFAIDSRKVKPGSLFFALKGTQTDGHLFVDAAFKAGATGAVVEKDLKANGTLVRVEDSMQALHDLATYSRKNSQARFIGITGSAGKTSTKEFAAKVLMEQFSVYKSEGNLNSITGLPLSLLAMNDEQCAVFEAGMNHPGEIASLGNMLRPHVAVLLNVNPVHIEYFDSIEGIAAEKASLADCVIDNGPIIYNGDDELLRNEMIKRTAKTISFGRANDSDLRIDELNLKGVRGLEATLNWSGEKIKIESSLCGMGNAYNIAAAVCVALVEGMKAIDIQRGVKNLTAYSQRGILTEISGIHIYDDSYNSNPRALEFALQLIANSKEFNRKVAIVGDMLELGEDGIAYHEEAGRQAAKAGIKILITAGSLTQHMADEARKNGVSEVYATPSSTEAAEIAAKKLRAGDLALIKGSRGMKMETVIERLRNL